VTRAGPEYERGELQGRRPPVRTKSSTSCRTVRRPLAHVAVVLATVFGCHHRVLATAMLLPAGRAERTRRTGITMSRTPLAASSTPTARAPAAGYGSPGSLVPMSARSASPGDAPGSSRRRSRFRQVRSRPASGCRYRRRRLSRSAGSPARRGPRRAGMINRGAGVQAGDVDDPDVTDSGQVTIHGRRRPDVN
jgi:hypothetical protein